VPVALLMVIDKANGGDVTSDELVRRFGLLHAESKNAIDFYFLGWEWQERSDRSKGIKFNLEVFEKCRTAFKKAGIKTFGGTADLILVDVRYRHFTHKDSAGNPQSHGHNEEEFNFPEAIHINLSSSVKQKKIPPVGEFLQSIIAVAEEILEEGTTENAVFSISDKLGIATAKRSFLDFILRKWGKIAGCTSEMFQQLSATIASTGRWYRIGFSPERR
jgi:hypothetical protein